MQVLYLQLNSLVVLTGISIAVIQYLFTNNQVNIKNLLKKVSAISLNFIDSHKQDNDLKDRWDNVINQCKEHSYSSDPNKLIISLFELVIVVSIIYVLVYFANFINFTQIISILLLGVLIRLIYLLHLSKKVFQEILDKEKYFKKEINDIQSEHNFIIKIIDNK